jgi:hypothetical protein
VIGSAWLHNILYSKLSYTRAYMESGAKRAADDDAADGEQEEGPPRPPEGADEDEPDVGPVLPKAKKRKVRKCYQRVCRRLCCISCITEAVLH